MRVALALVADHANMTREGKLNILGVFHQVLAPRFPCTHLLMHLVVQLESELGDQPGEHALRVLLVNSDGRHLVQVDARLELHEPPTGFGPARQSHLIPFANLNFPTPGDYEFHVLLDGRPRATVPLKVMQHPPPGTSPPPPAPPPPIAPAP